MMKQIATIASLLVAATLMSACSKQATPEAPKSTPAAAAAPAQDAPRPATYDPNLKPAEIVWDSPEKKAEWEAHQARIQAELQAANQAATAGQAAQAPAAPMNAPAPTPVPAAAPAPTH